MADTTNMEQTAHYRAAIVDLDAHITTLTEQRTRCLQRLQDEICKHAHIGSAPYREGFIGYGQAPFSVCLDCGYAEETWGCGPIELKPEGRTVTDMSRDAALACMQRVPGAFLRSNAQAVGRARQLGIHGWKPLV